MDYDSFWVNAVTAYLLQQTKSLAGEEVSPHCISPLFHAGGEDQDGCTISAVLKQEGDSG
jgi:hypothetical protein